MPASFAVSTHSRCRPLLLHMQSANGSELIALLLTYRKDTPEAEDDTIAHALAKGGIGYVVWVGRGLVHLGCRRPASACR